MCFHKIVPTYFLQRHAKMRSACMIVQLDSRLQLTKKQRIVAHTFFNTSFLEPQKPDFSQKKATKVDDHQAPRSQRSKKIWLVKIFLFDFSPNQTILSCLAKKKFSAFFGLLRPLKAIKAKKAKILLSKCSKTD